jgi:hypothetical protein
LKLGSVFIAESLAPGDFYKRRLDGYAANEILQILDVKTEYRVAFTLRLLKRAMKEAAQADFEILHFSSHGGSDGVQLTDGTRLSWRKFAKLVKPMSGEDRALVMATCGGGDRELTKALKLERVIFGWVFGSTAEIVHFSDCCLAWSILYNRLYDHGYDRASLRKTLKAINAAIEGDFVYRRWTGRGYRRFPRQDKR